MQKLIYRNSNDVTIDFTSGFYGITKWEGLSSTDVNIQSQQVPFEDGSVYIDSLLEQREISVTLAIQDNNNLATRYEKRREIISVLNPKLGEGTLYYKNDFTEKQIKCIPQLPIFENKNSNDAGTLKASLTFSCLNPYWEDVEETSIQIKPGFRTIINNNGDVPSPINIDYFTNNVANPVIKSFTEKKEIKLNGTFNNNININTNIGQKSVTTEIQEFNLAYIGVERVNTVYAEDRDLYLSATLEGSIIVSKDAKYWEAVHHFGNFAGGVKYFNETHLFIVLTDIGLTVSNDGYNWTDIELENTNENFGDIAYSLALQLYIYSTGNHAIYTSADGINWTLSENENPNFHYIIWDSKNNIFVGYVPYPDYAIYTSADGINWTSRYTTTSSIGVINRLYYIEENITDERSSYIVGLSERYIYFSSDGINWDYELIDEDGSGLFYITYMEKFHKYIITGALSIYLLSDISSTVQKISDTLPDSTFFYYINYNKNQGLLLVFSDGDLILQTNNLIDYEIYKNRLSSYLYEIEYIDNLKIYLTVGQDYNDKGGILKSKDGYNWEFVKIENINLSRFNSIAYSRERNKIVICGGDINNNGLIVTSEDSVNWNTYIYENTGFTCVRYLNNKFIVCGRDNNNGFILTSNNGNAWDKKNLESEIPSYIQDICFNTQRQLYFSIYHEEGTTKIKYSSDLIHWLGNFYEKRQTLNSICYSENLNVLVAVGEGPHLGYCSNDGGNSWVWLPSVNYIKYNQVRYIKELNVFYAIGYYNKIYYSINGLNWFPIELEIVLFLYGMDYNPLNNTLTLVGQYGSVLNIELKQLENIINSISPDSDLSLSLEVGENDILVNKDSGDLNAVIRYRQKYIGV